MQAFVDEVIKNTPRLRQIGVAMHQANHRIVHRRQHLRSHARSRMRRILMHRGVPPPMQARLNAPRAPHLCQQLLGVGHLWWLAGDAIAHGGA